MNPVSKNYQKLKYDTLKHFWGYTAFRDSQEAIIDSIVSGHDTLALLPTGGGKSLCYQLPSLITEGMCLVVSPLIALMKDQVDQLQARGIEAEYLSSELEDFEEDELLNRCKNGLVQILYVSPERLSNPKFLSLAEEFDLSFIAVDEAHCISEWGQDFRPSYQNIKIFRANFKALPCLALTATATPMVIKEIIEKLGLKQPQCFQKSYRRENLSLITHKVSDKHQLIHDLLTYNPVSGIIYTRTRKDAEELSRFLNAKGHQNVDFYHAGLPSAEKHRRQKQWQNSDTRILVSTNAFGMGIDKDNVRLVIHYSPPSSLEHYYQEIGRAGRDGQESYTHLLWNPQELQNFDDILGNQIPSKTEYLNIIRYIYSKFQVCENELPQETFQLHTESIRRFTRCSNAKIKNVLGFLHHQEIIYLNSQKSLSTLELKILPEQLDLLPSKEAYFIELLLRNLAGISQQKAHFSENTLASKLGTTPEILKENLIGAHQKNHLHYIDGAQMSLRFLKERNDKYIENRYWTLFEKIQRNKLQKWEEMKFFLREEDYCKMKLILAYFGEKNTKNCQKCSTCKNKAQSVFGPKHSVSQSIETVLKNGPATIEQIALQLKFHRKEILLETLIDLLDEGRVKMLNFRTYALA
ncbi:RecQ family ATP-dependent DNA helicase [Bergeyella sp. RCAD1439]|uniref:RecQ family ATP-dependent DNA helicase n=1 Tax=Bergeyella anatis TaxID=3113737 RepID=UPI002E1749D7|nr:ATP-dependent DNA helicase RecQ [Bergeyella sp. RCAD1439]